MAVLPVRVPNLVPVNLGGHSVVTARCSSAKLRIFELSVREFVECDVTLRSAAELSLVSSVRDVKLSVMVVSLMKVLLCESPLVLPCLMTLRMWSPYREMGVRVPRDFWGVVMCPVC